MSEKDFRSMPTMEQLVTRVIQVSEIVANQHDVIDRAAEITQVLLQNVAELNLKVLFLMNLITVTKVTSAVLDPVTQKPQTETKTAQQLYNEGGKASVILQIEALHAQTVRAEGDGDAPADEGPQANGQDPAGTVSFTSPHRVTH